MIACSTPTCPHASAHTAASAVPNLLRTLRSVGAILDFIPDLVVVVNGLREIVYANRAVLESCCARGLDTPLGRRLGEALNCRNRHEGFGGCGTSDKCRYCAALQAVGVATAGRAVVQDMRLNTDDYEAFDLRIHASPFVYESETFALLVLQDISAERRREILERVFLHDLLNTAGSLQSLAELLLLDPSRAEQLRVSIAETATSLVQEIMSHRLILAAERNEITVNLTQVDLAAALRSVADAFRNHRLAKGKAIVVDAPTKLSARTDGTLLHRILVNLVKNALEASRPGDVITLGAAQRGDCLGLWCHNPAVMPAEVRAQVFQRNFSTKGSGRGLGTYSIRLLAEKYLKAQVYLESAEGCGTRFDIVLPLAASAT